jgi:anti-sigma factor RsiW
MNCPDYRTLLQRRLDGELSAEPADGVQHRTTCPDCRDLHAAAVRLEAGLRGLPSALPPTGLTDRIVARVLAERRVGWRFRRRVLAVASLAAGLLLAAAGAYLWVRLKGTEPAGPQTPAPVAIKPVEVPQDREKPVPAPPRVSLNQSVSDAGTAMASLTRRTVDGSRDLLPGTVSPPSLPAAGSLPPEFVGPPAQSLREAGQGMSAGFEPMTTSARRAVDLFLREIPPMEPEQKRGI